jgi:hypothetical protein
VTIPYSTQFAASSPTGPGGFPLYTVPAGYVAVVRDLEVGSASAVTGFFSIQGGPGFAAFNITQSSGDISFQWQGRVVLNAGETLEFIGNTAAQYSVIASGFLLQQ